MNVFYLTLSMTEEDLREHGLDTSDESLDGSYELIAVIRDYGDIADFGEEEA